MPALTLGSGNMDLSEQTAQVLSCVPEAVCLIRSVCDVLRSAPSRADMRPATHAAPTPAASPLKRCASSAGPPVAPCAPRGNPARPSARPCAACRPRLYSAGAETCRIKGLLTSGPPARPPSARSLTGKLVSAAAPCRCTHAASYARAAATSSAKVPTHPTPEVNQSGLASGLYDWVHAAWACVRRGKVGSKLAVVYTGCITTVANACLQAASAWPPPVSPLPYSIV